jgi:bacillithiol biosynthesis cysteine-adding enzyme BshC
VALIDALGPVASAARGRATIAPQVLATLEAQNAKWGPSARRDASVDALRRGAVVVVTGQQVGLGLGPLYTIHKAASAVAWARALEREGIAAVPIFWVHAEDHDFDEVRTLRWAASGETREASLPQRPPERARISLAHERVGPGIDEVLAALERDLGGGVEGASFLARFAEWYRPDATLADAFGGLLAELFEPHGLLTFQPRDAAIAPLAAEIHRRVIDDHAILSARSTEHAARLEAAGRRVPVPVRPECALSFFHPDGPEGPRYRLVPRGDTLALSGGPGTLARAELDRRLAETPLDLSSSALLRPVIQDHLLPTAAYVGGPTELAYAAQLEPIYAHLGMTMAPFVRRASFVVTSAEDRSDLASLGIDRGELAAIGEAAIAQRLGRGPLSDELEALAAHVDRTLGALRGELEALDPGLGKTAGKTQATIEHALTKLRSRAERAASARHPDRLAALRRVSAALRPGGAPQERVHGLPSVARLGTARLVSAAIDRAPESDGGREVELAL